MTIKNEYSIKDEVYLISDPDQNKLQILAILVLEKGVLKYTVRVSNGDEIDAWEFELSKTKFL